MSRREQLLGLGDNLGAGLGVKVERTVFKVVDLSSTTTKLPDQLGYLIKHADGKLEVHSSMAWRLNNMTSTQLQLWGAFGDLTSPDFTSPEQHQQLMAQNESMTRLAQERLGASSPDLVLGQLAREVQSPQYFDLIFQAQAKFKRAQQIQKDLAEDLQNRRSLHACLEQLAILQRPKQEVFDLGALQGAGHTYAIMDDVNERG